LGPVLEHGIGGASDLPISPELAIAGAVAALTVSFAVLALAWRAPRYDAATSGRPAPAWLARTVDSKAFGVAARVLGLAYVGSMVLAAVAGPDLLTNPFFYQFYVHLWVGLVPLSLLCGPALRAMSPWRTINAGLARLSGGRPDQGIATMSARWGVWPAAFGLLAFVWLELVYPYGQELAPVRLWFAVYAGAMLVGGAVFGSTFYERADPFEVYSTLVSRMSVWGRRDDGTLVVRSPLANLDATPVVPGLAGVTAVLFGSTAFDSFKDSSIWLSRTQTLSHETLVNGLGLLGFCALVGGLFAAGTMSTRVRPDVPRRDLPDLLAHSIVPIIVGYIVAHYLTYFIQNGQLGLILMSDPLGRGDNLLGTGDLSVHYWPSSATAIAVTKVLAVICGHVLGVVAAHDRAIKLLPKRDQVVGQLPLLVVMLAFTAGGLFLLFSS